MTALPPPYGLPSGYPPGHRPPPTRGRPSAWWFVVGAALLLGAVAAAVGLFWWTLSGFLDTEAHVAVDGGTHRVDVGTDGDRMLWVDETVRTPTCRVLDRTTGEELPLEPVHGDFRRSSGTAGDWRGTWRFDPGSGHLEVSCSGAASRSASQVEIGAAPRIGSFVVGILATILVPLVLGLAGLATLIVTGVLWAVRARTP